MKIFPFMTKIKNIRNNKEVGTNNYEYIIMPSRIYSLYRRILKLVSQ